MHFKGTDMTMTGETERIEVMQEKDSLWSHNRSGVFITTAIMAAVAVLFSSVTVTEADVFGVQMFTGKFKDEQMSGFNPNYQIAIGDKITVRIWGAVSYEGILSVDPQGNIFIPQVGPVNVLGARNDDLNIVVEKNVQKVFKNNIGVYASLDAVQPVKVFVTGFVKSPGLYGGISSNSVLYFIDKAGGVDPGRGSFIDVTVLRDGNIRKKINLYDFLLQGKLDLVQFADGDVIFIGARKHTVSVLGEVYNSYEFEIPQGQIPVKDILSYAQPKPPATYVSIARKQGTKSTSEYYPIEKIEKEILFDGDIVSIYADRYPGTILVRVEGAHSGEHALVLPYGSMMNAALSRIVPNSLTNLESVQLFRKSVALRQKDMIQTSLQVLQTQSLTATSATAEEVALRAKEAEMIQKFVEVAKTVEPKGQIILGSTKIAGDTLLEDGDIIRIPEHSSIVMVHGEVLFPSAISFRDGADANEYIRLSGGVTQKADKKVLILHQNGMMEEDSSTPMKAGDEIMVLPKVETKRLEITRAISQIIYQIAIAARVVLSSW